MLPCSTNMVVMVSPATGQIMWQNSASCAGIGTIGFDCALPVAGSCSRFELDYLAQVFWGPANQVQHCFDTSVLSSQRNLVEHGCLVAIQATTTDVVDHRCA